MENRDTAVPSNKVVFVRETPHSYAALINAEGASGRQAWPASTRAGSAAVMNTVAYNLPQKSGELQDLEGVIMADALRTCATVEDFERLRQSRSRPAPGQPRGHRRKRPSPPLRGSQPRRREVRGVRGPGKYPVVTNSSPAAAGPGRGRLTSRSDRAGRLFAPCRLAG